MNKIWRPPAKSQEFIDGPQLVRDGDNLELRWDFETDDGTYDWDSIRFAKVFAFRFTQSEQCSPEQIRAYDTLMEVDSSEWSAYVVNVPLSGRGFRIYFDDIGCYEFLAQTVLLGP